jgi:hypothetical protein
MIFLHLWFLTGTEWITKKQVGFRASIQIMYERKNIGKLTTVIGQKQGQNVAKTEAAFPQPRLECTDF